MAKTLLIIEDDPFVQRFYKRLFSLHDYTIEVAGNGNEGLEKAKALKPALTLLDIMMPGMDGIQVLEQLKKDPETKDLHIVVLTNFDEEELVKKAVALGAIDFIIKSSVGEEELLAMVDKYLKSEEASSQAPS